jgi:hypothetical protein
LKDLLLNGFDQDLRHNYQVLQSNPQLLYNDLYTIPALSKNIVNWPLT